MSKAPFTIQSGANKEIILKYDIYSAYNGRNRLSVDVDNQVKNFPI